jgi:uncharacterized protein (DUF58 family)
VRRAATPKLGAYAGLAALALLAALVVGLPELVVVALPFALVSGVGLALGGRPLVDVGVTLDRDLVLEGDDVTLTLSLASETPIERLDLLLDLPPGLAAEDAWSLRALRLSAGERRELELRIRCERWGAYRLGNLRLRAHDMFGLIVYNDRLEPRVSLKVYPRPEAVRSLFRPFETQVFVGNLVSREKGEGIEFADLRPFVVGDRIRRINWRASARRGELWVNELHAERNADVVLFLDTFTEARRAGETTLDRTVRGAAALAAHYLRHKDRVGLVTFGGVLNWLLPATGLVQLYRIIDSLLESEIVLNYAWKDIDVLPRRTLPPKALVIALTPLLDDRAAEALLDLRARGFDLTIVDVSPVPFVEPGESEDAQLAYRIWQLRREARRGRYEQAGAPVVVWDDAKPLAAALEEVTAFRRHARVPAA